MSNELVSCIVGVLLCHSGGRICSSNVYNIRQGPVGRSVAAQVGVDKVLQRGSVYTFQLKHTYTLLPRWLPHTMVKQSGNLRV